MIKTRPNKRKSVQNFLKAVASEKRRNDAQKLLKIMQDITKEDGVLWGDSIIGFGSYHYVYKSGQEGDWFQVGFSPRKSALVLYTVPCTDNFDELVKQLGNVKHSVSCVYIKDLNEIDMGILKKIIRQSVQVSKKV
jgi:hypothetical protein